MQTSIRIAKKDKERKSVDMIPVQRGNKNSISDPVKNKNMDAKKRRIISNM